MKQKVLAYITRCENAQLLVFDHRDYPEAGTQVPAGTVEDSEAVEVALWREVREESGLEAGQLQFVRKLAEHMDVKSRTTRHVFHLAAQEDFPDFWVHSVYGAGEDEGLVFVYRWEALPLKIELSGQQGLWFKELKKGTK